ncbi:hypothetical protein ACHAXR_004769 [Thalassiosira sp. AJA248-18]
MNSSPMKGTFPFKLYEMIEHAGASPYSSVVSWNPDGRSFAIQDIDTFMRHIVPRYFKQTKYRSFTRQLNIWGFQNLHHHEWMHRNFVRGNIDKLHLLQRRSIKANCKSPTMKPKQNTADEESSASEESEADDSSSSRDEDPPEKGLAQIRSTTSLPQLDSETSRGNNRSRVHCQPTSASRTSSLPLEWGFSVPPPPPPIIEPNGDDYCLLLSRIFEL